MDYSFLKLYDSINDALNDNQFKDSGITYYTNIQLFTDEPYLQMTNYEGGISIDSDFTCFLTDTCGNQLSEITQNVFIEEFTDADGNSQCKIEFINIPSNFYGRAVIIKIAQNSSNIVYFTRPVKITNKGALRTYRIDYKNDSNLPGLTYDSADCYQSIRLSMKYIGKANNSEVGEYYQISTSNNISTRFLKKIASNFLIENIDTYTFDRLQEVLLHDVIYIDGVRLTDKPILEFGDRIGESNTFRATFSAYLNEQDKYTPQYQVFEGFKLRNFYPFGSYATGTNFTVVSFEGNLDLTLNTGFLYIYNSLGVLQDTFTEADMSVVGNELTITTNLSYANDDYYVNVSEGLVSGLGIDNEIINDNTTWTFRLKEPDYSITDYDPIDYNAS